MSAPKNTIWIVGSGEMALHHANVLRELQQPFIVIGNRQISVDAFTQKSTIPAIAGGIEQFLASSPAVAHAAIVAVNDDRLSAVALKLLEYGVKNILVEKPGGLNLDQIKKVAQKARECNAHVYVGYNRRFYASVIAARFIIKDDGGILSYNFEFTEWAHVVEKNVVSPIVRQAWFYCNSTHVVDLAFHLGGRPKIMHTFCKPGIEWHPAGGIFSGAGETESGALFSYQANWAAPGRWSVELLTQNHRLILRPLEQLQIMKTASVAIEPVSIGDGFDKKFKPGIYLQDKAFVANDIQYLCSIDEQRERWDIYERMLLSSKKTEPHARPEIS